MSDKKKPMDLQANNPSESKSRSISFHSEESKKKKTSSRRPMSVCSQTEIRLQNVFVGSGEFKKSDSCFISPTETVDSVNMTDTCPTLPGDIHTNPDESQDFSASASPSPQRQLSILVLGLPGAGKSTLVNSILNISEAEVKHGAEAQAHDPIEVHKGQCEDAKIIVCDTKGLSLVASKKQIQKECRAIYDNLRSKEITPDLVFVCVKSTERFEKFPNILHLASYFGIDEFWKRTIVVLTCANILPFMMKAKKKEDVITNIGDSVATMHKYFTRAMAAQCVHLKDLPYICVGQYLKESDPDKTLVTTEDWVRDLIQLSYDRCSDEKAKLALKSIFKAHLSRVAHEIFGRITMQQHSTCKPVLKTMATSSDIEEK